ncbi:hypothetical protein C2845_PM01G09680 [Panicum miliaceum]|uniref:Uncharacterized protein n=1 Tax=Panicum miliaceum TaxID=4540 RepID=A0A3L6TIM1_PANMI|nr:hypothetical protein C2845_PM01G09680 [Panicum miliaceum]
MPNPIRVRRNQNYPLHCSSPGGAHRIRKQPHDRIRVSFDRGRTRAPAILTPRLEDG